MDRLLLMETFVRVVDTGSFSAAAGNMRLSKAAVSKYITMLESRLGVQLLNRTTRRLSLTQEGAAYVARCRRLLEDVQEAEDSVGRMRVDPKGLLRLNGPMSFGHLHLASAIADFMVQYPEIEVDFELSDRFVDVVEEGWDMVIRIGRLQDSSLYARKLAPVHMTLCGSPAYFARQGIPQHPKDLARHHCLGYTYVSGGHAWTFVGPEGEEEVVSFRPRLRINNGDAIRIALLQGLGVAVSPTFIVGRDLQAGSLQTVMTEWALPDTGVYAVYPHHRHLSVKVRIFIDFLLDRFGSRPYWDLVG